MKEKIERLAQDLLILPQEVFNLQMEAIEKSEEIQVLSEKITLRENEIKSKISSATDDLGKKLHSNEEARKSAFLNDSILDSSLMELRDIKKRLETSLHVTRAKIELNSNLQRNIRSVIGVVSASSVEA